jgi:hypothetical protein
MTTATFDRRTASIQSLANALHLMDRRFGSTHTPADYIAQATADLDRRAAEPRPLEVEYEAEPISRAHEAAEYRYKLDREMGA